ncbi:Uncharacterised protein [Klebsiella pneumoniae]|nr:Uncharacterised protein [Klebsiella pneumoniae]
MRLVKPVSNVPGLIRRLDRVEGQHAHQLVLHENQEHFGVTALVQHLVALHVAARVLFAADMLRPVEGGLQPGFVFDYEVVQIGGIALFDGAKLDFLVNGDDF